MARHGHLRPWLLWHRYHRGIGTTEAFSFAMVHWLIQEGFVLLLGLYALVVVAFRKNTKI